MDIKKVEDTVKKSESLINTIWEILGRHWGKLIVITLIVIAVWFAMLVKDEVENPTDDTEQVDEISSVEDDVYYDEPIEEE